MALLQSAHDVSEGGLFVALVRKRFSQYAWLCYQLTHKNIRKDAWLFGEAQSRVVVSV
jgi:phosphoribosylformylglycinamidine (FGAM) synthase-like enzyme